MRPSVVTLLLVALPLAAVHAGDLPGPGYEMVDEPSGTPYDWTITGEPEKPWNHPYHKMIVTKLALCDRNPDGSVGHIRFDFEQTLDIVRKLHNIIPDLPKIIYIVGWQFHGHDSKYPAWSEVNVHLKRPQDPDAVTSLRWLMRESREKYNTYISLHINMLDAYPDSPLWDTYLKHDIICKNRDGSVRWSDEWSGMRAACISYYQEWKLGYAQKRIDDLVAMLPELKESGTIHIDAFQAYDGKNRRVSDYLDHTLDDEVTTMWKIFRYWRDKHGIDVTAETFFQKRGYRKKINGKNVMVENSFAGVQPFCWLDCIGGGENRRYLNSWFPPQIYTKTLLPLAPCFNHYQGQQWKEDHQQAGWERVKRYFFTTTVPHYLRNVAMENGEEVPKEMDPEKRMQRDICLPIGWRTDDSVAVYAHKRGVLIDKQWHKVWTMPSSWKDVKKAKVVFFSPEGWEPRGEVDVVDRVAVVPQLQGEGHILTPIVENYESSGTAKGILKTTGVTGGLVVHVGCRDGRFTAALHGGDRYLVQGLAANPDDVAAAREHIFSLGLSGKVSVDSWRGKELPYVDNLVNLVVVSSPASVARDEILRVLAPGGTAVFLGAAGLEDTANRITKSWPGDIDQWTHYLHDPDNNAVARDRVVGAPRRMQWVAGPRWTRHHNFLNSISSVVTANGRLFCIVDEASPANLNLPGRWAIVARGAFNGVTLWNKPMGSWAPHRQRFRTGPAQLPRLLVASDDRLYVPLGLGEPVSAIDAATGETVATYAETREAEEILLVNGTLLVLRGDPVAEQTLADPATRKRYGFPVEKTLIAVNTESGETLWSWSPENAPVPLTLASDGSHAYIRTDGGVIGLDIKSGKEIWRHAVGQSARRKNISYAKDTLVVVDGVVLCNLNAMLTALSAKDGKKLWECNAGSSFHAPVDVFVIDGLVWHKVSHSADPMRVPPDQREARDLHTGELKARDAVPLCLVTPGHHFRCYRAKATERFIITGKRGVEMMDVSGSDHSRNNWVRGTCQYGVMPANGLLYVPPNSCACFSEAALRGFWSYAPESSATSLEQHWVSESERLEKGIAYRKITDAKPNAADSWPTYRQDSQRGGVAATDVPARLKQAWCTNLGGRLTQPTVADGRVVLADRDAGIVYALDAEGGKVIWKHIAGGRVDSPPTLHEGKVLFGSGDGRVTCLRLCDGALAWRFLAAPADLRAVAFDRLESPWPVSGSVLVLDGMAYACAGRSSWIDGGMLLYALDPATGQVVHRNQVRSIHPEYREQEDAESVHIKGHLWTDDKTFTQSDQSDTYSISGGLADIPTSDGTHVFLRHLMFDQNLEETAGRKRQLFSTSSLLDESEHHRTGWGLGTGDHNRLSTARYSGGFSRFHLEDQQKLAPYRSDQPIGLMLVHDENTVWGIQRARSGEGKYNLFRKAIDATSAIKAWKQDLPVRPRAMLKSGEMLFLAVMPTEIPTDDPHAAYDGRLGGSLWVCSENDGSQIAEYPLSAPVNWDGMAAADHRLYLSIADGRLTCMTPVEQ